ncbi:endonuclease/exonuclease/phosphatase family protein [Arthrobacter parietis]|uniref:Endonuclease/exonuclease/phosphatase family protein n=1 Tax=Arthrobacter parietis TaxID=271434 RepID=A0ABP5MK45_9MICC
MGFAKKRQPVEALQPDVAILPEVSMKAITESDVPFKTWVGSNPNKGLGVLGYGDRTYVEHEAGRLLPWHIPFSVDGMNIVALWAHVHTRQLRYVRVTHEIVDRHQEFLRHPRSLLTGDFNSSALWDKLHPSRNHSMLVDKLEHLGLDSVYHRQESLAQGGEEHPTFFAGRNPEKPHHIDYAFLSSGIPAKLTIGRYEDWLPHSDHMPLILDIAQD